MKVLTTGLSVFFLPPSNGILIAHWAVNDTAPKSHLTASFSHLLLVLTVEVWVLQEPDSETEFSVQDT